MVAVKFERKFQINIEWNWHDGYCIVISKSINNTDLQRYAIETLIYFLKGKRSVQNFYAESKIERFTDIRFYSFFLLTYIDEIIEFVSNDNFESQEPNLKKAHKELLGKESEWVKEYHSS